LGSKTKSKNFQSLKLFPYLACCGYQTSNQKVLIYTTHIKKEKAKLNSFIVTSKITEKQ